VSCREYFSRRPLLGFLIIIAIAAFIFPLATLSASGAPGLFRTLAPQDQNQSNNSQIIDPSMDVQSNYKIIEKYSNGLHKSTDKPDLFDIEFTPPKHYAQKIILNNVKIYESLDLGIDTISPNSKPPNGKKYARIYAIDPSHFDFEKGSATIVAKGTELYKCIDWDKDNEKCEGAWDYQHDILPNEPYEIEFTDATGYAELINITNAIHLDANREFIEEIYEKVRYQDNMGATIANEHFVRVTFEQNLTSENDITIYAFSNSALINVYEKDGSEIIATFNQIDTEQFYQIFLENLNGIQDTFDLQIIGSEVHFDYIVDPSFEDTDDTDYDQGAYVNTQTDGENITLANTTQLPCTPSTLIPDVANHYATVDNGDGTWTTTWQPNAAFGKDTYILGSRGDNDGHGSCDYTRVGTQGTAARLRRSLVEFDVSVLPSDITITNAYYSNYIYEIRAGDTTLNLHRLTHSWTEGSGDCSDNNNDATGATWDNYDGSNAWGSVGGDFDASYDTQEVPVVDIWLNYTITSLVNEWYSGTPNYGFILVPDAEGSKNIESRAYSSDYATAGDRPKLFVTYEPSCYYKAGNFTSQVFDAGSFATWDNISWGESLPAGTEIVLRTHLCDDSECSGEASIWGAPFGSSPQVFANNVSRYFQYRATLNTSDLTIAPVLQWVNVSYTLDTTNPLVTIDSITPNPGNHSETTFYINFSASDLNFDSAYVNVSYPDGSFLESYTNNFSLSPAQPRLL